MTSLVVAALVATLLPAGAAWAARSFTFYGSGFGHGLGMSQWGAYGLAQQGWSHAEILTHFFQSTKIAKATHVPATLRIGLTQNRSKIRLEAQAGRVSLRVGDPKNGPLVGEIPRGTTWKVVAAGSSYHVIDANGHQVGGDRGGPSRNLYATYAGARVRVPEGGGTYARGHLEFNLYGCANGSCVERLVLPIAVQDYLYGLSEVPSSWPMQALEAQAIAARSYAFVKARYGQHRSPCNCALYDTSVDQVYAGWAKEAGLDGDRWVRAVDRTNARVVDYGGSIVEAFYASSSGGFTENNENVWGGTPIPWLRGVCDPGDYTSANPQRVWQLTFDATGLTRRLRPYTGRIGTVQGFGAAQRGVSGRILTIQVNGSSGAAPISGTQLRAALGLPDDRVWINSDKNVTGAIRTKYDHLMCAPGLPTTPQTHVSGGTRQKFEVGAIYRNAGGAVTVWLKGPVYQEFVGAGGVSGPLGLPAATLVKITGPTGCGGGGCARVGFDRGRIYWKSGVGAYALWGSVLDAYLAHHAARGRLGFPTSRVSRSSNGSHSATFEHGVISCDAGGKCAVS